MDDDSVTHVRAICLAFPEATERETWGEPTFRIRAKIFAMHRSGGGGRAFWCKASPGAQGILVAADPTRFFVPPYVGHRGWIGVRLDDGVDWDEVADLIAESYRLTAPRRLVSASNLR